MRTSFLQDLYLQRPITTLVLICAISVLPWIGLGDFSTKGEPREAAVAISMLESGNWVLPTSYADEFAFKPPMAHWLMAIFSYPQGYVSEFTARLPSSLAFIFMMVFVLTFFAKRTEKFQEAFIAVLILITCVEIHRAAITTRVDMLLTSFMVIGLIQLFRWEELQKLKGLPPAIPILLGCAVLTKGPVGLVLPLFVFGVYLFILGRYRFLMIVKSLLYIGVSSLFLPALWYIAAWRQGGDEFLEIVLAENFGRFFSLPTPEIHYELGHENGVWFNFMTLALGFVPWSLLAIFSLFGMKIRKPTQSFKQILKNTWTRIRSMEKVRLFSLVALVCIIFFYSIPSSKRSVYLMPAYPFIALFAAQFFLYLAEYRTKVTRVFAIFMASAVGIVVAVLFLTMGEVIDPVSIAERYVSRAFQLHIVETITQMLVHPSLLTIVILTSLVISLGVVCYQLFKKINIKILYATIGLMFCINLLVDGVIMLGERRSASPRPFAERIMEEYPLNKGNVYVTNNLREYHNLYGLNFYMKDIFHNFESSMPDAGFILAREDDMTKLESKYGGEYTFQRLTSTTREMKEVRRHVILSRFFRKKL